MNELLTQPININQTQLRQMQEDDNRRIVEDLRRNARVTAFSKRQFNVFRKLTAGQHTSIANYYDASSDALSARKKRINVRLEPVRRLNQLIDAAYYSWRAMTVPYPEQGRRVIRVEKIADLERMVAKAQQDITEAEIELQRQRDVVLADARQRLGKLFNEHDYPSTFVGNWGVELEYPNVEPDPKLCTLHPEIYEREVKRIRDRFNECVQRTEQELTQEFAAMVGKLTERLQPNPDGSRKVFHKSTVTNLQEFFGRFRELNLGSNSTLDGLVTQAQGLVEGVQPEQLKKDASTREQMATAMTDLTSKLEAMLTDAPNRAISFEDE